MQGGKQAPARSCRRSLCVILAIASLCACKHQLHSQISESDANEILATLYTTGIRAVKIPNGEQKWAVEVDEDDMQRALQVLHEQGLPHEQFANTGEIFKKEGLVSTPSEERIRFIYAVSQELANTLSKIDGVVAARVHPVIPANNPLASEIRPSSASVFIKHRHDANLQTMAPAIKNLVMRGIEGLTYDNISLTFVAAEEPSRRVPDNIAVVGENRLQITVGVLSGLLLLALAALVYLARGQRAAESPPALSGVAAPDNDAMDSRRRWRWWDRWRTGSTQAATKREDRYMPSDESLQNADAPTNLAG